MIVAQQILSLFAYQSDISILASYSKGLLGTLCGSQDLYEITSEGECKAAAAALGLEWKVAWNGPNDFPACFHAEDGRNKVFFNTSPSPRRTNLPPNYAAICTGK